MLFIGISWLFLLVSGSLWPQIYFLHWKKSRGGVVINILANIFLVFMLQTNELTLKQLIRLDLTNKRGDGDDDDA